MAVRNQGWYNLNELRTYPLSDAASQLSDAGLRLPPAIITDLNLRYPSSLGLHPFVSSVVVSEHLVSVTLQAATDEASPGFTPLAVISVARDQLVQSRQYNLEPQHPGVGGWIVFGSGVTELFNGRFSTPNQSALLPQACRAYRPLPVTGLKKLYADSLLTGVVTLRGIAPIEVVAESRDVDDIVRDVIVVRLAQDATSINGVERNVFEAFAGPCGHRPESGNCGNPAPVEFLNTVAPDCNGNITIVFTGCATIAQVMSTCGIVIDCGLGLTEACLPDTLPAADGSLRTNYPDQCDPGSEVSESEGDDGSGDGSEVSETPVEEVSESSQAAGSLPYIESFNDQAANFWTIGSGAFTFTADDSGEDPEGSGYSYSTEVVAAAADRNLSVWAGFDDQSVARRYTIQLKMLIGPSAAKHNGGLVFNRQPHPTLTGRFTWFLAEIDYDTATFKLQRFNGTSLVPLGTASVPGLALNAWFKIAVEITQATLTNVSIEATLTGVTTPAVTATIGPVLSSSYLPAAGDAGVHANRAYTRFSYFLVEEI
jgi:hypothetical protein